MITEQNYKDYITFYADVKNLDILDNMTFDEFNTYSGYVDCALNELYKLKKQMHETMYAKLDIFQKEIIILFSYLKKFLNLRIS